jgi:mono/diheme cytochrome c family protein
MSEPTTDSVAENSAHAENDTASNHQPRKKKRLLRFGLYIVLAFFGLAAIGFGVLHFAASGKLNATVEVEAYSIDIPVGDEAAIERGKYLVNHVVLCIDCHGEDLGGMYAVDEWIMARLYAPNITMHPDSVVADYTAEDWVRSVRHGVAKDGRRLLLMPSEDYYSFGDGDLGAIIAYIKSLPAVDRKDNPITLGPIGKLIVATGELDFAYNKINHTASRPDAEPGPTAEWGEVMIGACIGCHGMELSGGMIPGGDPKWPAAANLTPAEEGLAGWSYEDFVQAMRHGKRPDGTEIRDPMPWKHYAGMYEDDVLALWKYLQTVPARPFGNR